MTFFHNSSIELIKNIPIEQQKIDHIEFTHPSLVKKIISIILKQDFTPKNILEPGCGSGEFLYELQKVYPYSNIVGIDQNKMIVDTIQYNFASNVTIEHKNFFNVQRKFDLIIGWIPFYLMKRENVRRNQQAYIEGRPNSSILYLLQACELIEQNGIIAFILPASFLSGHSYNTIRDIINTNYQIISVFNTENKTHKTHKKYIVLIIQRTTTMNNESYTCYHRNCITFNEPQKIAKIKSLITNHNIHSMLLDVKIGTVAMNTHAYCFTNDPTKTQLIYSSNLKGNTIIHSPSNKIKDKTTYVDKEGILDPVIVVNRGYGKGKFHLEFCLIDQTHPFLIENHLMYIYSNQIIPRDEKLKRLRIVQKSLEDPRTNQFVCLYFGNSAINSSELNFILPLYIS